MLDEIYEAFFPVMESRNSSYHDEQITPERAVTTALHLSAFGTSFYKGFCDAQNIPFSHEVVEYLLMAGPSAGRGLFNAVVGFGMKFEQESQFHDHRKLHERIFDGTEQAVKSTIGGVVLAATETAIGYSMGYGLGMTTK